MAKKNSRTVLGIMLAIVLGITGFMYWSRKAAYVHEEWQVIFPTVIETLNKFYGVANANSVTLTQINQQIVDTMPGLSLKFTDPELKFSYISRQELGSHTLLMIHFLHQDQVYLLGIMPFEGNLYPHTEILTTPGDSIPFHAYIATYDGKVHPTDGKTFNSSVEVTILATNQFQPYQIFFVGRQPPHDLAAKYLEVFPMPAKSKSL